MSTSNEKNDISDHKPAQAGASPFDSIRKQAEDGSEYWSARELAKVLGYGEFRFFRNALKKAEIACANSDQPAADHFVHTHGMVAIGSGARRKVEDVLLSRYGAYLTVQNADPEKEIVALGQTYFAVQAKRQEEADALAGLTETQRRLYLRDQLASHNKQLALTVNQAGVVKAVDFAIFQDHGYMGLYNGLKARDIQARKGLKQSQQILDHMSSEELAANLFRATQTEAKIRREGIQGKSMANQTHYNVGKEVRDTIERLGGTMPEELPTPKDSIQQLEQKEKKRLKQGPQLSLFDEPTE